MRRELVFVVLMSIFLLGCAAEQDEARIDWRTGTQGIDMNFLVGSPPQVIYDGDTFDIGVEIWNRGAVPLVGDLYLSGFDDDIFGGISKRPSAIDIEDRKTRYNEEGGYTFISQVGRMRVPDSADVFETNIKAVACYFYETIADVPVCVDPEPNKRDKSSDACQVRDVTLTGGQAAPVAVTRVRIEPTPQKTIFRITLQNVGGGTVLDQAVVDECLDPDVIFADTNWIDIESVRLGINDFLDCEPSNPVKMSGGTATIACQTARLQGTSAFTSVLTVEASYGYREDIDTSVQIRSTI